jgi:uncharacterized oligopeptide transporter (OPT) family protein
VLAAIAQFWKEGMHLISAKLAVAAGGDSLFGRLNEAVLGTRWTERTVSLAFDPVFVAGGMIMGLRAALSVLLGAVSCWVVFVPIVQAQVPEAAAAERYRDLVQWALWGGVACMVSSSLLSVGMQWRSVARAFSGLGTMFGRRDRRVDPLSAIETPTSWFAAGQIGALIGLAWMGHLTFAIPVWQSALAVVMSFGIALVACRVTGETDTTPVGPMGKVVQLAFGVVAPGAMNTNIMSANIAAGAATSSADLLTDLKSGYLLGANPRKQFIAQFAGIFVGTVVTCVSFSLLVTDATAIGNDQFPAPSAQTWKGVAEAMSLGISHLHAVKAWSILIGAIVGVVLVLLPRAFGRYGRFVPSPAGLGLAWTFHFHYGLSFAIGAVIAWIWQRRNKESADELLFTVASGIIAGGALMGVGLVFYENGPEMVKRLFGG